MESIKETELNLQREVVTTVPNTWLVEAVNPSTGEKKMIDIANYASVVAEQMGSVITGVDVDTIYKTGIYSTVGSSNTNLPAGFTFGMLIVFSAGSSYRKMQLAYDAEHNTLYGRAYNNAWTAWQRLDNFGYNTLAELAGGIVKEDPTRIKYLLGKRLIKVGQCTVWNSGSFIASVATSTGAGCSILGIAYRHMSTTQEVSYSLSGTTTLGIEIYKKLNGDIFEVYMRSIKNEDSLHPMCGFSTAALEDKGVVTDLSSYTLVASL